MHNDFTAIKKIKDLLISFFKTLAVGIIAGLLARFAAFPIMGFLHNRWITIISSETVDLVYFWIGQIVGSLVFIIYMYIDLRDHAWSKLSSILAVISSVIFLKGYALDGTYPKILYLLVRFSRTPLIKYA